MKTPAFRTIFLIVFLAIPVFSSYSQSPGKSPSTDDFKPGDLVEQTLPLDIESADFYSLAAWCRSLGISDAGTAEQMRTRLRSYYQISSILPKTDGNSSIVIESAAGSRYFTFSGYGSYVELTGGVVVTLTDTTKGVSHRIEAGRLLFQQNENILYAFDKIHYTMDQGGVKDEFTGESLVFRLDTWDGIFYKGYAIRQHDLPSGPQTIYVSGETIERTADDHIIVSDGIVTTCLDDDPHFSVIADRIWLLSAGEWAVSNVTLKLGTVPILTFPFFYNPGSELILHPSWGFRSREGYFLQTTTYLMGQMQSSDSIFSFLKIDDSKTTSKALVQDGIFLVPAQAGETTGKEKSGWYLKLLADVYSHLGVFTALDGAAAGISGINRLTYYGGIAVTRTLQPITNGFYVPEWIAEDGNLISLFDYAYWGPLLLPFRYGFMVKGDARYGSFAVNADISLYSDPYFSRDFGNRSESSDVFSALIPSDTNSGSEMSRLNWIVSSKLSLKTGNPLLSSFDIVDLSMKMRWMARTVSNPDTGPLNQWPVVAGSPQTEAPGRKFFAPETLTFPSLSIRFTGTLFDLAGPAPDRSKKDTKPGKTGNFPDPIAPWLSVDSESLTGNPVASIGTDSASDLTAFLLPPVFKPVIDQTPALGQNTGKISYTFSPVSSVDCFFNNDVSRIEDIQFSLSSVQFTSRNSLVVPLVLALPAVSLKFNSQLNGSGDFRAHGFRGQSISDTDWSDIQLRDAENSRVFLKSISRIDWNFLSSIDTLSDSQISWNFDQGLFSFEYDGTASEYILKTPSLTDDSITRHTVSARLSYDSPVGRQSITFSSNLPPQKPDFGIIQNSVFGIYTLGIAAGATYASEWTIKPLSITQAVSVSRDLNITSKLTVIENLADFDALNVNLKMYGLSVNYEMGQTFKYTFMPLVGWDDGTDKAFRPRSLDFSYKFISDIPPMWKNRITMNMTSTLTTKYSFSKVTESYLKFDLSISAAIYKFMKITFSTSSKNQKLYRYDPEFCSILGISPVNPVLDLLDSLNIFNTQALMRTGFKLSSISFSLVHELHDWDLQITYSGQPSIKTRFDGSNYYEWANRFSVELFWRPVPDVKMKASDSDSGFVLWG